MSRAIKYLIVINYLENRKSIAKLDLEFLPIFGIVHGLRYAPAVSIDIFFNKWQQRLFL